MDGAREPWPELLEDSSEELYEHAPCGYLSTLPDGTIVKVNQTFLDWTGYRREELVGQRRLQDLLTPGGKIYHETHYAPLLRMQGSVREIALELVCRGDVRLPVLVNASTKLDPEGAPALIRTTVFDATERRRYERELLRARQEAELAEGRARRLAGVLQASLIPPALPPIPGLDVAAAFRPAGRGDDIGGDFYDVFSTPRGQWAVVIGDVSGKGAEAAAVTALARHTIRAAAIREDDPPLVLHALNEALLLHGGERFCTVLYGTLERRGDAVRLRLSLGGHPPPILMRAEDAPVAMGQVGDLLGVWEEPSLAESNINLCRGDLLFLHTDGVIEARRGEELFGEDRLHRVLAGLQGQKAARVAETLVQQVLAFQSGTPRDDIAAVVIRLP